MAQRSKNLLEAFNTSQKAEKHESDPGSGHGRAGGPFAGPAPAHSKVRAPEPIAAPSVPESRAARVVIPPMPQAFDSFLRTTLPLLLVVAIAAFLLGRASVGRVDAGSKVERPPQQPVQHNADLGATAIVPAVQKPDPATTPGARDTSPLYDKRNKYTILVASYVKSTGAAALAWKANAYLEKQGFQVFPPYEGATHYQLFVGAAQLQVALDDVLNAIQRIPGPSGRPGDFSSAMLVSIDQYVAR
jgi:hypothetical protein